jgi:hypothetical protein
MSLKYRYNYRRGAKGWPENTARVLQGGKPADLPVQQVTKMQLVTALGLTLPQSILVRANEAIE